MNNFLGRCWKALSLVTVIALVASVYTASALSAQIGERAGIPVLDNFKGATVIIAEYGELSIYKVQIKFVFQGENEQAAAQPYIAVVHKGDDLDAVAPIPILEGYTHVGSSLSAEGFTIEDSQVRIYLKSISQDIEFKIIYQPEAALAIPEEPLPESGGFDILTTDDVLFSGNTTFDNFIRQSKDSGIPLLSFGNQPLPLYSVRGYRVWSLLDLVLVSITMLLSVYMLFLLLFRERDVENEDMTEDGESRINAHYSKVAALLALLNGPAALMVFMLTENTSHHMVVFDRWTILLILMFTAELLFILKATNRHREGEHLPFRNA
jgi:hypothetical protein